MRMLLTTVGLFLWQSTFVVVHGFSTGGTLASPRSFAVRPTTPMTSTTTTSADHSFLTTPLLGTQSTTTTQLWDTASSSSDSPEEESDASEEVEAPATTGGTATIPDEVFNLVKNSVGAGVLSLPAGKWRNTTMCVCVYGGGL